MTFDENLEISQSLPPYEVELRDCDNCGQPTPEADLELLEVHRGPATYFSNVCPQCAKPVTVSVHKICGVFYIFYIDGLGRNRKEIEVFGATQEEAVSRFKLKWIDVFNKEVIRLVIK